MQQNLGKVQKTSLDFPRIDFESPLDIKAEAVTKGELSPLWLICGSIMNWNPNSLLQLLKEN